MQESKNPQDLFRVIMMNIPMEIEPEVVDMKSESETCEDKSNSSLNGYSLKEQQSVNYEEGIPKYPLFKKASNGYLLSLGHIWKPVDYYISGDPKENYLYYGNQLYIKMK